MNSLRIIYLFVYFFCTNSTTWAQNLSDFTHKHKIQQCLIEYFEAKDKLGIVLLGEKDKNNGAHIIILEYNELDSLKKIIKKDTSGNLLSEETTQFNINKKDSIKDYLEQWNNKQIKTRKITKYREDGQVSSISCYDLESTDLKYRIIYSYNHINRLEAILTYDSEGKLTSKEEVTTFITGEIESVSNGSIPGIESCCGYEIKFNTSGKKISSFNHGYGHAGFADYYYDEVGLLSKTSSSSDLNKYIEYYKYDIHGNIIEEKLTRLELNTNITETERINTFEYEYDKRGNWVKKIEYFNFTPKKIVLRRFKYF